MCVMDNVSHVLRYVSVLGHETPITSPPEIVMDPVKMMASF